MHDLTTAVEMIRASHDYNVMGARVYKRTSTGAIQIWQAEQAGNKFRTIHGQIDGAQVTSEWTVCEGKNLGKKNETSPDKQAELEVIALYKKKVAQGKYTYDIADIDVVTYISPMLAQPLDEKRLTFPCGVQPKLDGIRCIINKDGMWSRKGKPFPACMHIYDEIKHLFISMPDLILDGELYNHDYKAEFEDLVSAIKQQKPTEADLEHAREVVQFHCYDIPSGTSNYPGRSYLLENLLLTPNKGYEKYKYIKLVTTAQVMSKQDIDNIYETFIEDGYEGAIIRLYDKPYEFKRTYQLMKYKSFIDEEFEVVNILEGKGNWAGHAKIAVLKMPNGETFGAGIKGSKSYAKKLLENKEQIIGKMATVTYFRMTGYGVPYLPIFKVLRDYE